MEALRRFEYTWHPAYGPRSKLWSVKLAFDAGTFVSMDSCAVPGEPAPLLFYTHIFKNAGWAIMANLGKLGKSPDTKGGQPDWTWRNLGGCKRLLGARRNGSRASLFTFARDPIDRFVSAYCEIEYRGQFKSSRLKGSYQRAEEFVQAIAADRYENPHLRRQYEFILGVTRGCAAAHDLIGKLESFEEDWKALGSSLGCDAARFGFKRSLGPHLSSRSIVLADAMRKVLSSRPSLMRAVCRVYLADFMMFNYSLPSHCKSMGAL